MGPARCTSCAMLLAVFHQPWVVTTAHLCHNPKVIPISDRVELCRRIQLFFFSKGNLNGVLALGTNKDEVKVFRFMPKEKTKARQTLFLLFFWGSSLRSYF